MTRKSEGGERHRLLRPFLPAFALLMISAIAIGAATVRPGAGTRQVAIIFNPFASAEAVARVIADSGVRMVRNGIVPTIVVVDLGQAVSPDDLYRAGAWLVVDAIAAGGCGLVQSVGSVGR